MASAGIRLSILPTSGSSSLNVSFSLTKVPGLGCGLWATESPVEQGEFWCLADLEIGFSQANVYYFALLSVTSCKTNFNASIDEANSKLEPAARHSRAKTKFVSFFSVSARI